MVPSQFKSASLLPNGSPDPPHGSTLGRTVGGDASVRAYPRMNGRERLTAHLAGEQVDHLPFMPLTMMLAADTLGVPYGTYETDPAVLAAAQIEFARRYDADHVSVIAGPGCEGADCGASVRFFPDQPPAIDESRALLQDKRHLEKLRRPDPHGPGRMSNRLEALRLLRTKIGAEKLVEGWVEGPSSGAAELRGISALMLDFRDDAAFVAQLFDFVAGLEIAFGMAQIEAGADLIGIGDAPASLVGPTIYHEAVWASARRMVDAFHEAGARVRLHVCGNTAAILADIARLGCDIVDVDAPVPMTRARQALGPDQLLLGNLDPVRIVRAGTPESVYEAAEASHADAGPRFIVGAGCEIPRDAPPANVLALARYARDHVP